MNNTSQWSYNPSNSSALSSVESRIKTFRLLYNESYQTPWEQIEWIVRMAGNRLDGEVLIFGAGDDAMIWSKLYRVTFLEDKGTRYRRLFENQNVNAYLVNYPTRVYRWKQELDNRTLNTLPPEIKKQRFDTVIIAGPNGRRAADPGRVCPILHSQDLLKENGVIFVFDIHRTLEQNVTKAILGKPTATHVGDRTIGCWC